MGAFAVKTYRCFLYTLIAVLSVAAYRSGLRTYLYDPFEREYLLELLGQHVFLVSVSLFLATIVGFVTGVLVSRKRFKRYAGIVMYLVGLGQTVPSLAVMALAMTFLGIGVRSAIFALLIYSALPVARNTLAGLLSVPREILDAARGMGLTPMRMLWTVELPNAMSVILTGVRVALVINIGTAALGYLIGAGGLGDLIFTGISLMQPEKLMAGAIPITLMALIGDYLCGLLGLVLIPKGLRIRHNPDHGS